MLSNNTHAFFELLRAGLWERDAQLSRYGCLDFNEILRLSEEQSVVGLVAVGLEHAVDVKLPKEDVLQFVGLALQLEQQNQAMNDFIGNLIEKMRSAGIYILLLKGQGVAQCYERPFWRSCGDVDLFLSNDNYKKAVSYLYPIATKIEEENKCRLHQAFTIDRWVVELHGSLQNGLWNKHERTIDEIQRDVFCNGYVRSWINGKTQVFLPRADEDAIIVFSHILGHFFKEGIGLRQICDWCRLLWTYKDIIDCELLERRLRAMGAITEWKTFAYLAVNILGMPESTMPFYENSSKWKRKAKRVLDFILQTGNFGHNRDYSYQKKHPFVVRKAISLWKHFKDYFTHSLIFPYDSLKVFEKRLCVGISVALKNIIPICMG